VTAPCKRPKDEIKGKVPDLYVSLKPGLKPNEDIRKRVENSVIREIGPRNESSACRARSSHDGKIMRRVLAAISNNEDAGDILTLANPEIVDEIRNMKS
jgi:acetyl-CoA synthetase